MSSLSRYNGFSRFAQSKLASCWESTEFAWNYRVLQLVCSEAGLTTVDLAKLGFFVMEWHPHIVNMYTTCTYCTPIRWTSQKWMKQMWLLWNIFNNREDLAVFRRVYRMCVYVYVYVVSRWQELLSECVCTNMYCLLRRKFKDGGPYFKKQ